VVVYNGVPYAYVKSVQGDIVAILDENGNTVVSYGYDAWGALLWCTGELAETLGKVQPFRYRGYVFDEETGLYYLRSRYYNPGWGRFVNADCLIGAKNNIIQNCFAYCENAPTLQKDADGMRSENEKKNEPRVGVYSVGVASNVTCIYECSYVQGYCWDDYGNVGLFRTYVGIPSEEELTVLKEDPEAYFAAGMSGVGVSVAYVTSGVQARDIFALAGKGCYIGGGADILISAGVDAVFLDANVNEIVDNRPCDGYQTSIGIGLGLAPLHMGNSFTIIKPLKWKGVRLSDEESKWMTGRPDN
jgi:RHS repeat-associated protein